MIKYKELKNYLESLGFTDESVKSSHFVFNHVQSETVILLEQMTDNAIVNQRDIISVRRHLLEKGLAGDKEFDSFLKASTKAEKKTR